MPNVNQRVSAQSENLSGSPFDQLVQSVIEVDDDGGDFSFQSSSGFIFGTNTQTSPGVFSLGAHSIVVGGTNLGYDPFIGFYPFSGIVTSLTIMRSGGTFNGTYPPTGNAVFDVTGINLNLSDSQVRNAFLDVFNSNDTQALEDLLASFPYNYVGSADADIFDGGNAIDDIRGGLGNDRLSAFGGNDKLYGQDGNDTLIGGSGADYLSGGTGVDTASYAGASAKVKANLADASQNTGDAAGDTFNSIENLTGTGSTDSLIGNSGSNVLNGGSGNDSLYGQDGNDTLIGGKGADKLSGGLGSDTASYAGAAAGLTASLANPAINTGDAAGDTYSSIENLTGSSLADTLNGNNSDNQINGGAGNDTIKGYGGNDLLTGGAGNDRFAFTSALNASTNVDVIVDMNESGNDTICLDNAIFTGLTGAEMTTLSAAQFTSNTTGLATAAGQRIIFETDTGELYYDSNGNAGGGTYVLFAKVDANISLTNADFLII
jgi:Ca2+-binding RTX toxin-like protein